MMKIYAKQKQDNQVGYIIEFSDITPTDTTLIQVVTDPRDEDINRGITSSPYNKLYVEADALVVKRDPACEIPVIEI